MRVLSAGITELNLTVDRLPGFYRQRDNRHVRTCSTRIIHSKHSKDQINQPSISQTLAALCCPVHLAACMPGCKSLQLELPPAEQQVARR